MKRRGGIRKRGESNTGGATASSSTTTRKSVGFAPSATPLPSSKAKDVVAAAVEKAVPISALKASTLPHSLRRHHAVCQFVHSLFSPVQQQAATQMTMEDGEVVDHTNGPLLLASFVVDTNSKLPGSATEDGDFQKHTGPSSSSSLALWTLSAHLSSESYNGMLAALDVALSAHMQPPSQISDTCRVRVLQEASATFCASLPMVLDASVDLGTVAGLRHGIVLLLALVLPCRRWGSNGDEDWLLWGLTFPRLGRSHTQLPREAAQVAAACCNVNANGWLAQSALLWSKTLTSLEAATGAAPLHAAASSHSIASPLQSSQWLDVPTGGLTSGSPNIDKWRLAEASSISSSRTLGAFTPLILTGATFHSQLHLAATRNVRPDTSSRHGLSSSFPSTVDTLQGGHEPSIQYLLGLLKKMIANWELDETATTTKSNPTCGNNKKIRRFIGGAEGAIVNLVRGDGSSALLLSTSTTSSRLPISSRSTLGTKRERGGSVKMEDEGEVVERGASSSSSRRDLMGLLVVAMQEGEGIPPYMRYIQRLSKDATAASSSLPTTATPTVVDDDQTRKFSSPAAAAVGVFDVESVFPTLADLPASIVTPSLWGAATGGGPSPADVLRGYGSKVQLEINEEFLAHIVAPRAFLLSSSTEFEGKVTTTPQHHHRRPSWIFPVVLWALDGPTMTVLLRQWVAGNEDGCTASNPLHVLCSYICKHLFDGKQKTDEYSVFLGAAIEHRVDRAQEGRHSCCSVVVDHALVHLLQGGGGGDVFGGILQAAIRLQGDVTQSARDASHGLLVWCYGGFEGMEASCYFPACAFTCLQ